MASLHQSRRPTARRGASAWSLAFAIVALNACASSTPPAVTTAPTPAVDPREGLRAGRFDAAEAAWNLKVVSKTQPPERFVGSTNSDLAFTGNYAIQGNYNGFQVWDISNPSRPTLKTAYYCPASQSDVSVYRNLLFVSGEGYGGRLDCGGQGVQDSVSKERLRGIRIFDITDIGNPKYVANVQTCRGSHTHTVVEHPGDRENVYVYVSGSAPVRSPSELPGCVSASPDKDPSSALFRIEVIQVPLANPAAAKIVSSPRIFTGLTEPKSHGLAPDDIRELEEAKARGEFIAEVGGQQFVLPSGFTRQLLDSVVKARGGTGEPTTADSATLRAALPAMIAKMVGGGDEGPSSGPKPGPTQCHDITVYPAVGLAGGACEGYGLLIDIKNPTAPVRIGAVADSNFAYWHSATFNNDGTKILFSDEWGGGGSPKCRASDPKEWGANAIFTIENGKMVFQSYYKLPAKQTAQENCVAHNGSLIPIPGRDVMVQAWYQGGISIFDWTDPKNPKEIAFFDRGPADSTRMAMGGSWSAYWYNGNIISSEIGRGLDIAELTPSEFLSQNEIDAAKTVHLDYFNAQGQPKFSWPPSFALARSFVDQLERNKCMSGDRISAVRQSLNNAERATAAQRRDALSAIATQLEADASSSCDAPRVKKLQQAVRDLSQVAS
ncbi:MAG TPA: hypothetical protein VFZ21_23350 [Gemmatimonadaceae bacterium]|jgi:hypothetical protein|nr:hypothetical protein [Gemmatimonadaceae bacterium]